MGFDGTGAEAKEGVRHANANNSSGKYDHAQPRPWPQHASSRQDDQRQSGDDAESAVHAANVLSHDDFLKGCGSG